MTSVLRFNNQKDEFSKNIKQLQNEAGNLLNELERGGKIKDVNPKIKKFAEDVNRLVEDLDTRIDIFTDLAFSISSELGDDYTGVSKNTWLEAANKSHEEGIFKWMHDTILGLLNQRWNKLNLGNGNGPSEPPPYNGPSFKNYKQIIKSQNNKRQSINIKKGELINRVRSISNKLSKVSEKVIPTANQPESSQP